MASSDTTLWRTTIVKKIIHALYLSVILAAFGWWLDFSMGGKLDDINHRLDDMNATMDNRLDDMSSRLDDMSSRLDDMNATMNSRFDVVHQDIRQLEQKMDRKFEQVDQKLGAMDKRLIRIELNFENLNEDHKWLVPTVRQIESDVAELTAGER